MCMVIRPCLLKKLPEQMGLHRYAVSMHADELVLEPPPKKFSGSAYDSILIIKKDSCHT